MQHIESKKYLYDYVNNDIYDINDINDTNNSRNVSQDNNVDNQYKKLMDKMCENRIINIICNGVFISVLTVIFYIFPFFFVFGFGNNDNENDNNVSPLMIYYIITSIIYSIFATINFLISIYRERYDKLLLNFFIPILSQFFGIPMEINYISFSFGFTIVCLFVLTFFISIKCCCKMNDFYTKLTYNSF